MYIWLIIMGAAFAGSVHCIGMCGGFACALSSLSGERRRRAVLRHLLYNCGRLTSYAFIGVLAGSLGSVIVGDHSGMGAGHGEHAAVNFALNGVAGIGQRALALGSGILMLLMGLQLVGLWHPARKFADGFGATTFMASFRQLLNSRHPMAPVGLGVLNGFLPCPLVWAFALQAAATGSALSGALVMTAFGLGTFPAMLFMGAGGGVLAPVWRHRGLRVAGVLIVVIGVVTVIRGAAPDLLHIAHVHAG